MTKTTLLTDGTLLTDQTLEGIELICDDKEKPTELAEKIASLKGKDLVQTINIVFQPKTGSVQKQLPPLLQVAKRHGANVLLDPRKNNNLNEPGQQRPACMISDLTDTTYHFVTGCHDIGLKPTGLVLDVSDELGKESVNRMDACEAELTRKQAAFVDNYFLGLVGSHIQPSQETLNKLALMY